MKQEFNSEDIMASLHRVAPDRGLNAASYQVDFHPKGASIDDLAASLNKDSNGKGIF